jgi:Immunity protein 50
MWPQKIHKSEHLKNLYREIPDFGEIEIVNLCIYRDGPMLRLNFISDILPVNAPLKWKLFNRVSVSLDYFVVSDINFREIFTRGTSTINSNIDRISVMGAFNIEFMCEFVVVKAIEPMLYSQRNLD